MKVNKLFLSIFLCAICMMAYAESDSIRIVQLEKSLQKEKASREQLSRELKGLEICIRSQELIIDSLRINVIQNSQNIKVAAEQLGVKINETNVTLGHKANATDVHTKVIWGAVCFILLAVICCVIYYLLHKKINNGTADVNALKQKAEKLNEDILNQLSLDMAEMQKISTSLSSLLLTQSVQNGNAAPDHSLVIILADRITFMEMTLSKMDPKVRGHKQLSKSIEQMKNNLLANGYELVDMLGKPYNDGMRVTASFIEDEELAEGEQIVTAIIKPQINYKGKMIQSAQITVSQNI